MRDLLKNTFRFFLEIPECFYYLTALERSLFFFICVFFPCYPVTCARSSYDRYISNRRARQRALGNNIIIDLARVKSEVLVNIYSLLNKIQNCVTPRGEGNENSQKNQ